MSGLVFHVTPNHYIDVMEQIPNPTRMANQEKVKNNKSSNTHSRSSNEKEEFSVDRQMAIRHAETQYNNWRSWGRQDWAIDWLHYLERITDPKLSNDYWQSVSVPKNTRNEHLLVRERRQVVEEVETTNEDGETEVSTHKLNVEEMVSPYYDYNGFFKGMWSTEPKAAGIQTTVPRPYRRPSLYQGSWRSGLGGDSEQPTIPMSKEARQAYLLARSKDLMVV